MGIKQHVTDMSTSVASTRETSSTGSASDMFDCEMIGRITIIAIYYTRVRTNKHKMLMFIIHIRLKFPPSNRVYQPYLITSLYNFISQSLLTISLHLMKQITSQTSARTSLGVHVGTSSSLHTKQTILPVAITSNNDRTLS